MVIYPLMREANTNIVDFSIGSSVSLNSGGSSCCFCSGLGGLWWFVVTIVAIGFVVIGCCQFSSGCGYCSTPVLSTVTGNRVDCFENEF